MSIRTGDGFGDLKVLPTEVRVAIWKMVPSNVKRFELESPCHWPRSVFDISQSVRDKLERCKDPNHKAATFKYDVSIAGKTPDTWIHEHLAWISAANGHNFTFSVIDSLTDLPKLHFQLLSRETRCFELLLSMANHRQMCEYGGQMQYMWDIAARIAVAIYDRPARPLTLTSRDPNDVDITHLEAVTQSLQQCLTRLAKDVERGLAFHHVFTRH